MIKKKKNLIFLVRFLFYFISSVEIILGIVSQLLIHPLGSIFFKMCARKLLA